MHRSNEYVGIPICLVAHEKVFNCLHYSNLIIHHQEKLYSSFLKCNSKKLCESKYIYSIPSRLRLKFILLQSALYTWFNLINVEVANFFSPFKSRPDLRNAPLIMGQMASKVPQQVSGRVKLSLIKLSN